MCIERCKYGQTVRRERWLEANELHVSDDLLFCLHRQIDVQEPDTHADQHAQGNINHLLNCDTDQAWVALSSRPYINFRQGSKMWTNSLKLLRSLKKTVIVVINNGNGDCYFQKSPNELFGGRHAKCSAFSSTTPQATIYMFMRALISWISCACD